MSIVHRQVRPLRESVLLLALRSVREHYERIPRDIKIDFVCGSELIVPVSVVRFPRSSGCMLKYPARSKISVTETPFYCRSSSRWSNFRFPTAGVLRSLMVEDSQIRLYFPLICGCFVKFFDLLGPQTVNEPCKTLRKKTNE